MIQKNCEYDELWFIAALFTSSVCFWGILKIREKIQEKYKDLYVLMISAIGMIVAMVNMYFWKIRIPWQVEISLMMCFYMALGYLYKEKEEVIKKKLEKKWILGLLGVSYCLLVFCFLGTEYFVLLCIWRNCSCDFI